MPPRDERFQRHQFGKTPHRVQQTAGAGEYDVPLNCVPVASQIVGWMEPTEPGEEVGSTHPTKSRFVPAARGSRIAVLGMTGRSMTSRSGISTAEPPHSKAPGAAGDGLPERPSPWALL